MSSFYKNSECRKFARVIRTGGGGLWSDTANDVTVTELAVDVFQSDDYSLDWGELRVFFDVDTWDCRKHGLIYTDLKGSSYLHWIGSFRRVLQ